EVDGLGVQIHFFDFCVGTHHGGWAPERNREHSIRDHAAALNVGFMERLRNIRLLKQPDYSGEYSQKTDPLWTYTPVAPKIDVLSWYHCDHLGTPQEMTDQNGQIVWSADYKAWG
ncbi:RHS domain-containing protein, partial [Pseudomonas sp. NPDC096917]|uniref:RHS domain-containing protein n=1 Tax=Pseudomonas sp. NPDC096917 TaxID=3364483 RepID=UPI00383A941F